MQEAIDEVNRRSCSFGSHDALEHQQVPAHKDIVLLFSDEEIENDFTSSVHLEGAIQHKSGNKRKRRAPKQSFDDRFNDLMAFKAKYGHGNVSQCGQVGIGVKTLEGPMSYKQIQKNQKLTNKLSVEKIQRLTDAGFKWSLRKVLSGYDKRFNDLMSFKAKYGHCNVSQRGEDASLGKWW